MSKLNEEEQKFWDYIKGPEEIDLQGTLRSNFPFGGPSRGHTLPNIIISEKSKAKLISFFKIKKDHFYKTIIQKLLDIYNLKTRIMKMNGMGGWTYMQTT